jgi:hypothetical protein
MRQRDPGQLLDQMLLGRPLGGMLSNECLDQGLVFGAVLPREIDSGSALVASVDILVLPRLSIDRRPQSRSDVPR